MQLQNNLLPQTCGKIAGREFPSLLPRASFPAWGITIETMTQRFETRQWVPFPVELVFAFFANPSNLPHLMPPKMKGRIEDVRLQPPPPRPVAADRARRFQSVAAGEGSEILISFCPVSWLPQRVSWMARITEFAWNSHFIDEQVRGPFKNRRCCGFCAAVWIRRRPGRRNCNRTVREVVRLSAEAPARDFGGGGKAGGQTSVTGIRSMVCALKHHLFKVSSASRSSTFPSRIRVEMRRTFQMLTVGSPSTTSTSARRPGAIRPSSFHLN